LSTVVPEDHVVVVERLGVLDRSARPHGMGLEVAQPLALAAQILVRLPELAAMAAGVGQVVVEVDPSFVGRAVGEDRGIGLVRVTFHVTAR
jgi:hypothetical protein